MTRTTIIGIALAAAVLTAPVASAQCMVTMTTSFTIPPSTIFVNKFLAAPGDCQITMSNNVSLCLPGPTVANVTTLMASASRAATGPYCQWQCDCGAGNETVRIDGSDGLPVELMQFDIEGSD